MPWISSRRDRAPRIGVIRKKSKHSADTDNIIDHALSYSDLFHTKNNHALIIQIKKASDNKVRALQTLIPLCHFTVLILNRCNFQFLITMSYSFLHALNNNILRIVAYVTL